MSAASGEDLVCIFGGSGFLGRHIVRALAEKGYRIRVAVRRPDAAGHLQPLGDVGQIHAVYANVCDEESVVRAMHGASQVVNLSGILFSRGKQQFDTVHVDGARHIAVAAEQAGCRHFVHMSAIGADAEGAAHYARSKGLGEAAVLEAFPNAVIFRPSIVFGPEDDFFNRFASMARISPVLPLIGGGKTLFQPVYVRDVADAVVAALEGRAKTGCVYELGGPEVLSFKDLLERVLEYTDRKCRFVSLPFAIAKIQAAFLQLAPTPILTIDQVKLLARDNVVSDEATKSGRVLAGLGIDKPTAIAAVVPSYLARFKPKGQFSRRRDS